ncbi:MAG: hypothetical protein ACRYFR_14575 [Janthinobacterium lividum]
MEYLNKSLFEVAVAKMEVLASNASQNLQAMQNELAILKQGMADLSSNTIASHTETETSQASQKDRSKWFFDGIWYNKRNFPLAVFKHYVDRKIKLAALEEMFRVENVYPEPIRGNKKVFILTKDIAENGASRYHNDVLVTKDGSSIVVTTQIGIDNFPQLVVYLAKCFGFPLKGKGLNRELWPTLDGADVTYLDE